MSVTTQLVDVLNDLGYKVIDGTLIHTQVLDFINSLFVDEPKPIFEHNAVHVLSYFAFDSEIIIFQSGGGGGVVAVRENEVCIFSPKLLPDDLVDLMSRLEKTVKLKIKILNVSKYWIDRNYKLLVDCLKNPQIVERSKEEAVYSVELLTDLSGKEFGKLRITRNQLLVTNKIVFREVNSSEDLNLAKTLVYKWNQCQGYKYEKNKLDKEIFVLEKIFEIKKICNTVRMMIGEVEQRVVSLTIFFRSPNFIKYGINYLLKGINRVDDGGTHGVSDATYLHVVESFKRVGCEYINDGELGTEEGTRQHKLRFKPVEFYQSFDVVL